MFFSFVIYFLNTDNHKRKSLVFLKKETNLADGKEDKWWTIVVSLNNNGIIVIIIKEKKAPYSSLESIKDFRLSLVAGTPTISPDNNSSAAGHRISALNDKVIKPIFSSEVKY